jgi:Flp pilus assembly protein TadD
MMPEFRRYRPARAPRTALLAAALAVSLAGCAEMSLPSFDSAPSAPPEAQEASLPALLRIADVSLETGDAASAAGLYRRAHESYPDAAAPLIGLGKALSQLGRPEEAVIAFRQALQRDPTEKSAIRSLAAESLAMGDGERALGYYAALLAEDAADHHALNGKGVALDMLGRHEAAWAVYREGLALAPGNIALGNNYGLSLAMGGRAEEGVRVLSALAREPAATPRTRQNLALALGLAGDIAAAKQVAALDLDAEQVASNAAFYEYIRNRQPDLDGALAPDDSVQ